MKTYDFLYKYSIVVVVINIRNTTTHRVLCIAFAIIYLYLFNFSGAFLYNKIMWFISFRVFFFFLIILSESLKKRSLHAQSITHCDGFRVIKARSCHFHCSFILKRETNLFFYWLTFKQHSYKTSECFIL